MSYSRAIARLGALPELQKKFNAFTFVNEDATGQLVREGSQGTKSLSNVLVGVKDNIVTKDMPTTCSSKILEDFKSPFDATVVELLKNEGAVIAGKTNLDEFGMGSSGIHSYFGPTTNPIFADVPTVVGGSSSGSAAAAAGGVVDFALGTDTGGSVRLPAAYTSILGFKPSYGRISRYGVIAYAQSFDTVGILSKDISIVKQAFKILDKHDRKDPTSLGTELRELLPKDTGNSNGKLRIGLPKEFVQESVPVSIRNKYLSFIENMKSKGHEIVPVSIPSVKHALPIYYTLVPSEASSNLSRFDGVRYGTRDEHSDLVDNTLFAPTRQYFGKSVQERIILGNYNLCSGSYKNNYIKAQRLRVQMVNEFDQVFKKSNVLTNSKGNNAGVDMLVCLTSVDKPKTLARALEESRLSSPVNEYITDVFTLPMSLAGLPTISIPIEEGEPVGVQLVGQYGDDWGVLNLADSLLA
ncbi:hypothetical protein Kpol_1067p17 [Vanderwaltozyma polyspora DSM 70294]|uniref:Glutamyl-tRNA(Gln) amidotransferase subunit A, mitochondrial n=1 Tax=Vanderwaltozyma polyspora (strain ATCC 22028 / DSM 70294 / BCRC 21397 / CBS 2163 / NBRC 10782 / NRRL Y-8283 / UCD 57-17) TaxID=436907 RepID=A7TNW2_VANPO|nr:uncharacterized protein Kpol_1067p17 [Vanderwaltozyma polyspora DSM 70294]EDO16045.1 hypothetical protein Kpol_1067p17 [Vanderwaltozyma polyspora DSM 70294]